MDFQEELSDLIRAGFSGLYLLTQEAEETQRLINSLARKNSTEDEPWTVLQWDCVRGALNPHEAVQDRKSVV